MRPRWPRWEWPGAAKPLKRLHSVAFGCIPFVDRGWGRGFTLILAFSPQGRRDLTAFAGTMGVGGATVGTESLGRGQAPVVYLGHARDRTG